MIASEFFQFSANLVRGSLVINCCHNYLELISEESGGRDWGQGGSSERSRVWEWNQESNGSCLSAIVNGDVVLASLESHDIAHAVVGLNTKERCLVKNDTSDTFGSVEVDLAAGASGEGPGGVLIGAELLGVTTVLGASVLLGLAEGQVVWFATFPAIEAGPVDVVPGVLQALVELVAVGVGDEETWVRVHTSTVEATGRSGIGSSKQ